MTDLPAPQAARLSMPRWLDARVVLGVLLVLLSVVAGARVFAAADNMTAVYVAAHELAPGEHISADDLTTAHVRLRGEAGRYIAVAAAPPVGYVVTRYVAAGELVPVGALGSASAAARSRDVTVPVQPGHLSESLQRGDVVDVYLTPKAAAGDAVPDPVLVLAGVPVESREGGTRTFSGNAALAVVLSVPADKVAAVVHAVESGTIDLVQVPRADAAAAPQPAEATP